MNKSNYDLALKDVYGKGKDQMPSTSKAQRRLMAIAEHHPDEVYSENKGVLKMSKGQLHDFAKTKEKGLPAHKVFKGKKKNSKPESRMKQFMKRAMQ